MVAWLCSSTLMTLGGKRNERDRFIIYDAVFGNDSSVRIMGTRSSFRIEGIVESRKLAPNLESDQLFKGMIRISLKILLQKI